MFAYNILYLMGLDIISKINLVLYHCTLTINHEYVINKGWFLLKKQY